MSLSPPPSPAGCLCWPAPPSSVSGPICLFRNTQTGPLPWEAPGWESLAYLHLTGPFPFSQAPSPFHSTHRAGLLSVCCKALASPSRLPAKAAHSLGTCAGRQSWQTPNCEACDTTRRASSSKLQGHQDAACLEGGALGFGSCRSESKLSYFIFSFQLRPSKRAYS